jgi:hypothetical protein
MATLPLGISVGVNGAAQAISSLGRVANASRRMSVGAIAAGVGIGTGINAAVGKLRRFAIQTTQLGAEMAQQARAGEQVSARFTDAGLAGAESLNQKMIDLRERMQAAFINATPHLVYFYDVAKARAIEFGGIALDAATVFRDNWDSVLSHLATEFERVFKKIGATVGNTALEMAQNTSEILGTPAKAGASLGVALRKKLEGDPFIMDWNIIPDMGDTFGRIDNPPYVSPPFMDSLDSAMLLRMEAANLAIQQARKDRDLLLNTTVRPESATAAEADAAGKSVNKSLSEALVRGSVAEASARAQAAIQNQQLALQKQQLAEQRRTTDAVLSTASAGGIVLEQVRV